MLTLSDGNICRVTYRCSNQNKTHRLVKNKCFYGNWIFMLFIQIQPAFPKTTKTIPHLNNFTFSISAERAVSCQNIVNLLHIYSTESFGFSFFLLWPHSLIANT